MLKKLLPSRYLSPSGAIIHSYIYDMSPLSRFDSKPNFNCATESLVSVSFNSLWQLRQFIEVWLEDSNCSSGFMKICKIFVKHVKNLFQQTAKYVSRPKLSSAAHQHLRIFGTRWHPSELPNLNCNCKDGQISMAVKSLDFELVLTLGNI